MSQMKCSWDPAKLPEGTEKIIVQVLFDNKHQNIQQGLDASVGEFQFEVPEGACYTVKVGEKAEGSSTVHWFGRIELADGDTFQPTGMLPVSVTSV